MKNAILAFGAVVGIALVAVPVVSVGIAAVDVVQEALHPSLYQLSMELDDNWYIVDYNLSRSDCQQALKTVHDWTDGRAHYSCDRAPKLEPAT